MSIGKVQFGGILRLRAIYKASSESNAPEASVTQEDVLNDLRDHFESAIRMLVGKNAYLIFDGQVQGNEGKPKTKITPEGGKIAVDSSNPENNHASHLMFEIPKKMGASPDKMAPLKEFLAQGTPVDVYINPQTGKLAYIILNQPFESNPQLD